MGRDIGTLTMLTTGTHRLAELSTRRMHHPVAELSTRGTHHPVAELLAAVAADTLTLDKWEQRVLYSGH